MKATKKANDEAHTSHDISLECPYLLECQSETCCLSTREKGHEAKEEAGAWYGGWRMDRGC